MIFESFLKYRTVLLQKLIHIFDVQNKGSDFKFATKHCYFQQLVSKFVALIMGRLHKYWYVALAATFFRLFSLFLILSKCISLYSITLFAPLTFIPSAIFILEDQLILNNWYAKNFVKSSQKQRLSSLFVKID